MTNQSMRIKICGITDIEQAQAISSMGATDLGFICYPKSPRYLELKSIQIIIKNLPQSIGKIGVFVNENITIIEKVVKETNLTAVQLHGNETPEYCDQIRHILPEIELIKALRIKNSKSLKIVENYYNHVNTLLLDAYHPQLLGGTGHTVDWQILQQFNCALPWFLAGGLTPDNIQTALSELSPNGIDLSSGVEKSPGNKDLNKVFQLFENCLILTKKNTLSP